MTGEHFLKKQFIKALELALATDYRSNLEFIVYEFDEETQDETIEIFFKSGGSKKILATENSNGDNAKAIIKEIYGD